MPGSCFAPDTVYSEARVLPEDQRRGFVGTKQLDSVYLELVARLSTDLGTSQLVCSVTLVEFH